LWISLKRECAYSLMSLSDWKWDKMCVKIGEWKCSTNENKYNSVDCKKKKENGIEVIFLLILIWM